MNDCSSAKICENIFSTGTLKYLEYSSGENFKEVSTIIEHLRHWHERMDKQKDHQAKNTKLSAANKFKSMISEELQDDVLEMSAEYLEDNFFEESLIEVDYLQSDDEEVLNSDNADVNWKPETYEVFEVDGELKVRSMELENKNEVNNCQSGNVANTMEDWLLEMSDDYNYGKENAGSAAKTTGASKKLQTFRFNLSNTEYKNISFAFLTLLEARPCLWNTSIKSQPECTAACNEIILQLRKNGFCATDSLIESTISEILQEYKSAELKSKQNSDEMNLNSRFLLEKCQFLNGLVKQKSKSASFDVIKVEDETEEKDQLNTLRKTSIRLDDMELKCDDDSREGISACCEYSKDWTFIRSQFTKKKAPYKCIRFQLIDNAVAKAFIHLLRINPITWDYTHSGYRKRKIWQSLFEGWIDFFEYEYNVTFSCEDFFVNCLNLQRYYRKLIKNKSKRKSKTNMKLIKRLDFLSMRKMMCNDCGKFLIGLRNFTSHQFRQHGVGCDYIC